jgi:hypothetical protein
VIAVCDVATPSQIPKFSTVDEMGIDQMEMVK